MYMDNSLLDFLKEEVIQKILNSIGGNSYPVKDIDGMTYEDLDNDRQNLLNLKDPEYFSSFLQSL